MTRVILAAAAVSACASNDSSQPIERTFDPCDALALVAEAPTEAQAAGMQSAQELWQGRGFAEVGRRSGITLEVRFEEAAPPFHGYYDDHNAVIYINRSLAQQRTLSIVIAHELGHAFGLVHVDPSERASVMNPGNLTTTPTDADRLAVEKLWGTCQ